MSDTNAAGAGTNYDWREDLAHIAACYSKAFRAAPSEHVAHDRLAAHIESLTAERDALLAEHEWEKALRVPMNKHARKVIQAKHRAAHDHAEEVLRRG